MATPGAAPPRPATMRDVAAAAGVSLKTVSRVVNREAGVSGALAERVAAAVVLLGYRHDLAASGLRRSDRKTATVGLLLEDVSNPFDAALHRAVEDVARRHGSLVLAASSDSDPARQAEVVHAFALRRVDGLLAVPSGTDHSALLHEHRQGLPVVFADRPDVTGVVDSVVADNRTGSALAVRHLAAHGHRRVALLADRAGLWTAAERVHGFCAAMAAAGLATPAELVRQDVSGSAAACAVVEQLLALPDPPTAVYTAQNVLTVGAVQALQRAGRPVALVGFDDFPLADLLAPAVTVVAQDVAAIGREAAELLFARIGGTDGPARLVTTAPRLVPRGSGELHPP